MIQAKKCIKNLELRTILLLKFLIDDTIKSEIYGVAGSFFIFYYVGYHRLMGIQMPK